MLDEDRGNIGIAGKGGRVKERTEDEKIDYETKKRYEIPHLCDILKCAEKILQFTPPPTHQ